MKVGRANVESREREVVDRSAGARCRGPTGLEGDGSRVVEVVLELSRAGDGVLPLEDGLELFRPRPWSLGEDVARTRMLLQHLTSKRSDKSARCES